jgi:putative DNA primase/helicase
MSFELFAANHGLIIKNLVTDRWVRVPTTDHPHKRNGAYYYQVDSGAVQNWAVHEKPIPWRSDSYATIDHRIIEEKRKRHLESIRRDQANAAKKAAWIMHSTKKSKHEYLAKKGFPNEQTWVWNGLMVVPMRTNNSLVGCQLISPDGIKRFLTGQKTKGASAVFDNKGVEILCEGYATALSIRRALKAVRKRYKIIVCFSAGNILEIAKSHPSACLVADTDKTGINTAIKTGLPYWKSDVEGEDFNDAELRVGAQSAGEWLLGVFGRRILGIN